MNSFAAFRALVTALVLLPMSLAHALTGLTFKDYVKAHNTGDADFFGTSVAVYGNTMVVGAPSEDGSGTGITPASDESSVNAGAVYVYERINGLWSQQAYLKASNTGTGDFFGSSVAISGDTIIVGAPYEDGSGSGANPPSDDLASNTGAIYVFVRKGGTWMQQAYLKASNSSVDDQFGSKVAISGNTVVVGVQNEDGGNSGVNSVADESASSAGAAYVFVRNAGVWSQEAYLKPSNPGTLDYFGKSVAVSGDRVIVGAPNEDSSTRGINGPSNEFATDSGAAYMFERSNGIWTQLSFIKASNADANDLFGFSVSLHESYAVVGASGEDGSGTGVNPGDDNLTSSSGAAFIFQRGSGYWTEQARLKSPATGAGDDFGISVGLSGSTLVVGALYEDGSGTGINPAVTETTFDSGAAYVFSRNGSTWTFESTLKASNTGQDDHFGFPVAVSGGTIVCAAADEDGLATGMNPASNDLASDAAGAVYLFEGAGVPSMAMRLGGANVNSWDQRHLGQTIMGTDLERTFTIVNNGDATLQLVGVPRVAISGPDAAMFSVPTQVETNVFADGDTTDFVVRFTPTSPGTKNATITIANDDGNHDPFVVQLTATVSPPEIAVSQSAGNVPSGSVQDFGDVSVETSASLTFQIFNTGGADLTLGSQSITGPAASMFTITTAPVSPVVPGGSTTCVVHFAPTSAGTKSALLSIATNDADESTFTIGLTGNAPPAEIAVQRDSTNFADGSNQSVGGVIVGEGADLVLTVRNIGGATLGLNGNPRVTLSGPDAAMFSIFSLPATAIAPGDSSNFTIRFTPASGGPKSATLTIPNTDGNESPFDFTLIGTGLTFTNDQDNDLLSDASEFQMASLGFDWQVQQTAMVNQLFNSATQAGLYTQAQLQALNASTPLLAKNPATGEFTLTLGVQRSTDLSTFNALPMTAPQCTINGQGKLEFKFTSPGNTAFFRVQAQ